MHYHICEDAEGEVYDLVLFCCDACHRAWCAKHDIMYGGWSGCYEGTGSVEYCAHCGTVASLSPDACECPRDNVVVNRFLSKQGEKCKHGNWVQLPTVEGE